MLLHHLPFVRQSVLRLTTTSSASWSKPTPLRIPNMCARFAAMHREHNEQKVPANSLLNKSMKYAAFGGVAAVELPVEKIAETPVGKTATEKPIEIADLPEPPTPPIVIEDLSAETAVNALGEPTFASLGLGGWSPVGLVQNGLEYLHVTLDIPWWGAIALTTIMIRTLIFPLIILSQRNAAKMHNNMPGMQKLQVKLTEARQSGNAMESAKYANEMLIFMKEKEMNPFKSFVVPIVQAPLFISFFMALRSMANAPVESMKNGGLFWFTDLTVYDPTYILPLITSATLSLTIEIGTDSARLSSQNFGIMKYFLRAIPLIVFPMTMNFPSAILTYWACSNFISLIQVAFLRIPAIRDYFKIDRLITHQPEDMPIKKKKFVEGIKDSWDNIKITREIEDRRRLDEIRFSRAGKGPLIKTYKYDPTAQLAQPANKLAGKKSL